ncbi:MAG: prepilin peptidase [Actinomycetota bacterium]|nr:prepilin peptidase [Actinomycetota bacterium]
MTLAPAHPAPLWLIAAVILAGAAVGLLLDRRLAGAAYRLDDERNAPLRGGWLVRAVVPLVWGLLAWQLGGLSAGALLPAYLLLAVVGAALFRIDLDVHRLPEGLTLPSIPAVALLLTVASATSGDWVALGRAVAAGLGVWLVYVVLALIVPGGLGLGDATLGGLVSLPLGYLGWGLPVVGILAAYLVSAAVALIGLATRRLHLRSDMAFGPYILLGALVAVFVQFQIVGV